MYRWIVIVVSSVAALPVQSADAPVAPAAAQKVRPVQPPPLPPTPVEYFRQLLKMEPNEREKELVNRPKTREFLEAKLKEFQALSPEERENRLRTMELQWYLRPLFTGSPTNRAAQLQAIPHRDRPLIEERLKLWDQLPADQQRDVLKSELAVRVYYRPENGLITYAGLPIMSTQQQARIRASTEYLNSLPAEKREQIYRNFGSFFELSDHEKARTLNSFSEAERQQMEHTLQAFEKLPPQARERCIAGFDKFRALPLSERQQFLRSAERWQAMSAKDRQAWRVIVSRKALPPPPMPPGFTNPAAMRPPPDIFVATNANQ
jgi:hypothetical protein